MINLRNVVAGLAALTMIIGVALAIPMVIAVIYNEGRAVLGFALPMVIAICVGLIAFKKLGAPTKLTYAEAMVTSSIGWLVAAFFSSIPYVVVLGVGYIDACFEAFSSLTTTGMTIIPTLEVVPKSILFWRAFGEWIGGAGVILLTTLLISGRGGVIAWRLYFAEAREEKLTPTTRETIKRIWLIYVFYTALCAILLQALGLGPFEAICHAFTCLSTGGFSTRTESVGAFNSSAIEVVLIVFMILGATRFSLHQRLFAGDFKGFVRDFELKAFLAILLASSTIVSLDIAFRSGMDIGQALRLGFFNTISVGTTTGFTTTDIATFPSLSKALLLILMIFGGCINSTAGGVKIWRLAALFKMTKLEVEKLLLPPEAVKRLKLGGKVLDESEAMKVATFFFMYILFALVATTIMAFFEGDYLGSLSAVLSAMATVGPFYASPLDLHAWSKVILMISMWIGRLELIPVLLLFTPESWRVKRKRIIDWEAPPPIEARSSKLILRS